jgi:hypothetical protein
MMKMVGYLRSYTTTFCFNRRRYCGMSAKRHNFETSRDNGNGSSNKSVARLWLSTCHVIVATDRKYTMYGKDVSCAVRHASHAALSMATLKISPYCRTNNVGLNFARMQPLQSHNKFCINSDHMLYIYQKDWRELPGNLQN